MNMKTITKTSAKLLIFSLLMACVTNENNPKLRTQQLMFITDHVVDVSCELVTPTNCGYSGYNCCPTSETDCEQPADILCVVNVIRSAKK